MITIASCKKDFPIFKQKINGHDLVYLDSAASAQKPQQVIDAICDFYSSSYANIHRGAHLLSDKATTLYENARSSVKEFLGAKDSDEIIFTSGTTASINFMASSLAKAFIEPGDDIIVSTMEHHSNFVPWQLICKEKKANFKIIPINEKGELDLECYKKMVSPKTKIVAINHASNTLGTINPLKEVIDIAHRFNALTVVDGAQAVPHLPVNVQKLDCDFYTFSGHKLYGPSGIGVLYGKKKWLEKIPPYQTGGGMVFEVTSNSASYAPSPQKFEAGTPNIAGAIGLAAAIKYLNKIGFDNILAYEDEILKYAHERLSQIKEINIIGRAEKKVSLVSFTVKNIHPHDISSLLDQYGIAIRAGNLCTQPLMSFYHVVSMNRASFGLYNNKADVDKLCDALIKIIGMFNGRRN